MHRQVHRTLPPGFDDPALARMDRSSSSPSAGTLLIAAALGYIVAGRALAPLRRVTASRPAGDAGAMDERIAMVGPEDELRELADTVDGMLDRLAEAFEGQRRFVANASHELRTPLTVIRAEVEVTLADPDATTPTCATWARPCSRPPTARRRCSIADGARPQPAGAAAARAGRPRRRGPLRGRATAAEAAARSVAVRLDLEPAPLTGDPRWSTASSPTSSRTPCATT